MSRGIDHIVHAVRDLDAAAEAYRRLGFTVGARNRHPPDWGTQNHIVQLAGSYIELLGLGDTSQTTPHGPRSFSFGAFNRDFLARGQGLSMLVLEGRGAPDAEELRSRGIGDFEVYELERQGQRGDGSLVRLAFTLAFAADPGAPQTGFFTCHNRFPENFWIPALQIHANSAANVAGVVLVAENPSDHHIFLSAFTGEREMLATSSGISIKTPRGKIEVMTPAAFEDHFGVRPPDTSSGAQLAAVRFGVRDIDVTATLLEREAPPHRARMGRIVVGPDTALGAALSFEPI